MRAEEIRYVRSPAAPGLEIMVVRESARAWRALHTHHTFCAVLEGGGTWSYRGEVHAAGPGAVKRIAAGEVHRDLRLAGPTSCVALLAEPRLVDALARELGREPPPLRAAQTTDPECFAALRRWSDPHAPREDLAASLRATLRTLLARADEGSAAPPRRASSAVLRARALLHDRFDEPLALDEVAGATGLTKPRLVRAFHAEVGLPPFEYLMHLRVARAREGLRAGRSATDAALACGFCDQSHLTRWFKKVVGVTPGQYARALA